MPHLLGGASGISRPGGRWAWRHSRSGSRFPFPSTSGAGGLKAMAGVLYPLPGMVEELDSSLSLLEVSDGRGHQRRQAGAEEDADLLPMVFLCGGCKRPVGDTLSWVSNDDEADCIMLRSESGSPRPSPPGAATAVGHLPPFPFSAQVRPPASLWTRSGRSPSGPASADGEAWPYAALRVGGPPRGFSFPEGAERPRERC